MRQVLALTKWLSDSEKWQTAYTARSESTDHSRAIIKKRRRSQMKFDSWLYGNETQKAESSITLIRVADTRATNGKRPERA